MITDFKVAVTNTSGRPVSGAAIRLVGTMPLFDATIGQFGQSPVYADTSGVFRVDYGVPYGGMAPMVYVIYIVAPGYKEAQVYTEPSFVGVGNYAVTLERVEASPDVAASPQGSAFVCPMYPVEILVDQAAPGTREYIETTITDEKGKSVGLESKIVGGKARVNLQTRIGLDPRLTLIGDNLPAVIDPAFSATFTAEFESVTSAGRQPIGAPITYHVANAFPQTDDSNDLTSFTNETGLASWLSPWGVSWGKELPVFEGQYADAMVWLTKPGAGPYTLKAQYYDINRTAFANSVDALPSALFAAKKAVRIRIPQASASIYYAQFTVQLGGVDQTKPLYVRYIHG